MDKVLRDACGLSSGTMATLVRQAGFIADDYATLDRVQDEFIITMTGFEWQGCSDGLARCQHCYNTRSEGHADRCIWIGGQHEK